MNKIIMTGRLVNDPELRYSNDNKPFAIFTLVVNRTFKNKNGEYEADFFNCLVNGIQAENLAKYQIKGKKLAIEGRLQNFKYEKNGENRISTKLICSNIEYMENKKSEEFVAPFYQPQYQQETLNPFKNFGDEIIIDDDDLPF